ncbi:hypothetical protein AYO20_08882 [Fonsecaea nubica]|uniref:Uncharacterized protein n=1 Tax=Fonsecaea nubica TaxID=856822 RepID=A0A178CLF7_9EURO|nr:hypothetical protein AYO20_08882 [Fonsecaea nubica]OAL30166.1 hypothetical protein AYO20_08882 [Fonsecaea nubica]
MTRGLGRAAFLAKPPQANDSKYGSRLAIRSKHVTFWHIPRNDRKRRQTEDDTSSVEFICSKKVKRDAKSAEKGPGPPSSSINTGPSAQSRLSPRTCPSIQAGPPTDAGLSRPSTQSDPSTRPALATLSASAGLPRRPIQESGMVRDITRTFEARVTLAEKVALKARREQNEDVDAWERDKRTLEAQKTRLEGQVKRLRVYNELGSQAMLVAGAMESLILDQRDQLFRLTGDEEFRKFPEEREQLRRLRKRYARADGDYDEPTDGNPNWHEAWRIRGGRKDPEARQMEGGSPILLSPSSTAASSPANLWPPRRGDSSTPVHPGIDNGEEDVDAW